MRSTRMRGTGIVLLAFLACSLLLLGQGCQAFLSSAVTAEAGPNLTLTTGQTALLQGSAGGGTGVYTYAWSPSTGLSSSSVAQPTLTASTVGTRTYTLTVTDSAGERATDTVTVTISTTRPPVVAQAGTDLATAVGASVTLSGSATGGTGTYSYAWSPTTGLSSSTAAQPTFTPTAVGTTTFTLTVTDSEGSVGTDTVQVATHAAVTLSSLTWGANTAGLGYEVIAVFSGDLDETTAETAANYRINGTSTTATSATLASDNRTLTLVFSTACGMTTAFDLSVDNAVKDSAGASIQSVTAQTPSRNTSDATAPTFSSALWGENQTDGYTVAVTFSEVLDRTTAQTPSAYRIYGTTTTADSATLSSDGTTVTLVFTEVALSTTSTVDVSIGSVIKDINNNTMTQVLGRTISDNTADVTAPVVGESASHAAAYTSSGYCVTLEFSEVMSKTAVETESGYSINSTNPSSATLDTDGRTVTLIFAVAIATTDTLTVGTGSVLKDINGNAVVATSVDIDAASTDTTSPTVASRTWGADFTGSGYQILVKFNESMDKTSAQTLANYRINGTSTIPATATLGTDGKTVTLTFTTPLSATGTLDKLDVSVNSAITDINGNAMTLVTGQSIAASASDTTGPTVSSRAWSANQSSYKVIVTFNESMDETTATSLANYELTENGVDTGCVPTAASLDSTGKIVTLTFGTHTAGFKIGDTLTVSQNVRDINSRQTTSTTAVAVADNAGDTTAPTVASATRINATTVDVVFSEVMDKTTVEVAAYTVTGGISVTGAALSADGRTVRLTVDADPTGQTVTVPTTVTDINGTALASAYTSSAL